MSGVVRTLSRCLLPAEAAGRAGEQPRRDGKERSRDAEREARRRSREIDAMLARERRAVRRLVKILLLGAGESGKSTFLKQMRIIHGQDWDLAAREEFRATIYSNVIKGGWWVRAAGTGRSAGAGPGRSGERRLGRVPRAGGASGPPPSPPPALSRRLILPPGPALSPWDRAARVRLREQRSEPGRCRVLPLGAALELGQRRAAGLEHKGRLEGLGLKSRTIRGDLIAHYEHAVAGWGSGSARREPEVG